MSRAALRQRFLEQSSFTGTSLEALPTDASFRRYFRILGGARPALLMDAPPPREDVRPFVTIARHLVAMGLSAPRIFDCDEALGFLTLEDFGDDTYTRLLGAGDTERALYELGIDALCHLQRHPLAASIAVPGYDTDTCVDEASLFTRWYLPRATGQQPGEECLDAYRKAWVDVLAAMPASENTLILRDYHVDNLMRLPAREGVAACGLLDFQDAVIGSTAYDVVSLLEDARRDVSAGLTAAMLQRYQTAMQLDDRAFADFMRWYRVLGAQRHCRVLAVFVRLFERDGKNVYLRHLPRLERLLRSHLQAPQLRPLQRWFEEYLPGLAAGQ